ncbi:hypothetical protein NEMIN01_2215 [Nematocida minor]|uniref:uncharacterized protein n=1 Tax=Nematocida minor TaxID=1912983 RepID=UPI00222022D9|nr:uncharacterized protein NEMIN01_2215 [Nematocida minor]KAI5192782.1 hypothetical protein NEMIN01_2215 [Nematocida minor]
MNSIQSMRYIKIVGIVLVVSAVMMLLVYIYNPVKKGFSKKAVSLKKEEDNAIDKVESMKREKQSAEQDRAPVVDITEREKEEHVTSENEKNLEHLEACIKNMSKVQIEKREEWPEDKIARLEQCYYDICNLLDIIRPMNITTNIGEGLGLSLDNPEVRKKVTETQKHIDSLD